MGCTEHAEKMISRAFFREYTVPMEIGISRKARYSVFGIRYSVFRVSALIDLWEVIEMVREAFSRLVADSPLEC
ncbi:MAG: hypothetical protein WBG42_10960 [Cryomorphaceae bacterium]